MKIRHRLAYLIIIMSVSVTGICFFTFRQFYKIAIEEQRAWLASSAQIQARLIESMVRFNAKSSLNYSEGAEAEALKQVMEAHSNFKGFGKTGEFTIARKEGDMIVFLLRHRHYNDGIPDSVPAGSKLAEPMQLALDGKSGTMIGRDYHGDLVLAAYEPVLVLKLGIVAKIDVAEIRGIYIKSGIEAGVTAVLFILAGTLLLVLVTRPVIVELRQNENTLRLTLDATSDGSWDWDVPSGKIDFSDAWTRSFGYERGETGHDLRFWEGIIHPDDLRKFRDAISGHLEGRSDHFEFEGRIREKSGGHRWRLDRGKVVARDAYGKPLRMVGVSSDIEARKQAERALKISEEMVMLLLKSSGEGIYGLDLDGNCAFVNRACVKLLGYETENELIGKAMHGIVQPRRKGGASYPFKECKIHRAVRKGAVVHVDDEVFWRKDGTSFPVEYWSYPIERDGKIVGAAVTFIDITERTRMQAQLVHSEKLSAIGTFVAGVAHELNNPITAIHGFSRQLIKREYPMEEVRKKLGIIAREAERTGNLVKNLLRFSRKHQSGRSNVDINELVENSLELQTYQFQAESIEVARDFSERPLTARADPNQLQQVFLNIITNAQHAMASAQGKGTLRVETRLVENEAVIIFENSGQPMPDKILARIFDPFFTTKEAGKGSGLGLSICNEIMKDHGGRISAENIGQDGVRFIVSLPALLEGSGLSSEAVSAFSLKKPGFSVLIVEDEEGPRMWLHETLAAEGFSVRTAENGREALAALDQEEFDAVISDIKMPVMCGLELGRWLKENKPRYMERLVLATGLIDDDLLRYCSEHKCKCLHKPFGEEVLLEAVKEIIDRPRTADK